MPLLYQKIAKKAIFRSGDLIRIDANKEIVKNNLSFISFYTFL